MRPELWNSTAQGSAEQIYKTMSIRRIILVISTAAALLSCSRVGEKECLDFLYESMPLGDSLVYPRSYWEANVRKSLEVRQEMDWGIPDREWMHFVLPLRVNNENLDDFRTLYADTLCRRVKGMSLEQAALEINHWCHEQATYKPSDARTLGPVATITSGLGRCGEESVLAVASLRAAGIPARQVYTPRWAHTDDNHAWVEVWVDGKWHFMGACEPESVLDLAWFNAPVSRAMLLHTKVYGKNYNGGEDVIKRTDAYTEINVIKGYIPSERTVVTVLDREGNKVEGARVDFGIYNYAEFYRVASYLSGHDGQAALDTGIGDMVILASKDSLFGIATCRGKDNSVVLDKRLGKEFSLDLTIVPPVENPLEDRSSEAQKELNARRLIQEDSIRASHPHPRKNAVGLYLSEKDLIDVSDEVLEDAHFEQTSTDPYIVSPRIEREALIPFRQLLRTEAPKAGIRSVEEITAFLRDSIRLSDSRNPQGLRIPPAASWKARESDTKSRDILFVALCRSLDIPSRINPVDGKLQYRNDDGVWVDVDLDSSTPTLRRTGTLSLNYIQGSCPVKTPKYYTHFSISELSEDGTRLMELDDLKEGDYNIALPEGYYMIVSGMRLADGSVNAHLQTVNIKEGVTTVVPLVLRSSDSAPQVIGNMDPEMNFLAEGAEKEQSLLSATGRGYFLICISDSSGEPNVHARRQLEAISGSLNQWGRKVVVLGSMRVDALQNAVYGSDPEGKVEKMLLRGMESERSGRPVIALCDSFGRIVYFSQGYNTSLGEQLGGVISSLEKETGR